MNLKSECPFCGGKCKIDKFSNVITCSDCKWRFTAPKSLNKPIGRVLVEFGRRSNSQNVPTFVDHSECQIGLLNQNENR